MRYIFELVHALIGCLQVGKLVQVISDTLAKEAITQLARKHMQKFNLTKGELMLIQLLVQHKSANVARLAELMGKSRQQASKYLNGFLKKNMVRVKQEGNTRIYSPTIDAKIAFAKDNSMNTV